MKKVNPVKKVYNKNLNHIIMMSAWSFTMVVSSFLFLYVGRLIDVKFNTEPTFMLGLFVLGIGLCIGRIYDDYTRTRKKMKRVRRTRTLEEAAHGAH
jgi:F0F1-type ATP synthase assembly protein I